MAIARYKTFGNEVLTAADMNAVQDLVVANTSGEDASLITGTAGSTNEVVIFNVDGDAVGSGIIAGEAYQVACSDETTTITTGTAKVTFRMPYAATLSAVRASVGTASSSGVVTVDINESGTTILSTKLTIDANEKTSTTAATPAVISDSALADDAEITIDFDTAGTGAAGVKVTFYWKRNA